MATKTGSQLPTAMATKPVLPPIQDTVNENHRYRGYVYDLRNPRIPITGPVTYRNDINQKKYPLPRSLVMGKPVHAPTPPQGFLMGSDQVRDISAEERKENKINLRLLEKNSAELRKTEKAQQERLEFMNTHQKEKEQQVKRKHEEQEQDLKQLKEYNPFGKPGYGAPRGTGKDKTAISKSLRTSWGVGHVDVQAGEAIAKAKADLPPLYVKPRVRRYEDDRMRRYGVDAETAAQYKKDLDEHQQFRRHEEQKVKELDKRREEQTLKYDPFGKPGAGAPNRDAQGKFNTRRSISFSYTNNPQDAKHAEYLQERRGNVKVGRKFLPKDSNRNQSTQLYDPWGKDTRRKDKEGNIIKFPRTGDNGIYEFVDPNVPNHSFPRKHLGGGGEPLLTKSGSVQTKRPGLLTTIHGARRTENITKVATPEEIKRRENTSPWGRPGAGAPLKDAEGNIVKNTKGRIHQEALGLSDSEATKVMKAKSLYRKELQEGIEMQKELREVEKEYQRKPPGDVPSWFSKGQVGRPRRDPETGLIVPQKRIMSDVTAQKLDKNRPRAVEGYYRELEEIAQERKRKRIVENEKRARMEAKHFESFAANFDKPGNGAPNMAGNARRKFSTSAFQAQPQKGTQVLPSDHKTTLQSAINIPKVQLVEGDPAIFQTEYDHYNSLHADKQTYKVETRKTPPAMRMPSNPGAIFDIVNEERLQSLEISQHPIACVVNQKTSSVKSKSPVKMTQVFESKSAVSEKIRSPDKVVHYVTPVMSKSNNQCSMPFPYRVVAPWAVDSGEVV